MNRKSRFVFSFLVLLLFSLTSLSLSQQAQTTQPQEPEPVKALQEKQNRIRTLIKEGKTLEEIKEIFGVKDIPLPPGRTPRSGLVETIYLELTQKK